MAVSNKLVAIAAVNRELKSMQFKNTLVLFTTWFAIEFLLFSCQPEKCQHEMEVYKEQWNYTVYKTYRHPDFKATFIIETIEGKKLLFSPIQSIYTFAEHGDKIVKEKNSGVAKLIKVNGTGYDAIDYKRIYSPSCDASIEALQLN